MMNLKISLCLLILAVGCTIKDVPREKEADVEMDSSEMKNLRVDEVDKVSVDDEVSALDSIRAVVIDTSTLEGKRNYILREFNLSMDPMGALYDTLIDLNYDSKLDYVIGTHPQSGSGEGMEVYLYNSALNCYLRDPLLSSMLNPSLYLNEKRVTSFYLGYGSGSGDEYEWKANKWVKTKEISMINHGSSSVWKIMDVSTGKRKEVISRYDRIPPAEVLRTKYK
jgi:hypothetical protein